MPSVHDFVPLEISCEDMQAIVALCSLADVNFERRTDQAGLTQWRVWRKHEAPIAYQRAVTVYGNNLRAWQAAIYEVVNQKWW